MTLPGIGHQLAIGALLVPPDEGGAVQAATRGKLPLGFGWQVGTRPGAVGLDVLQGHMHHGVLPELIDRRPRTTWVAPVRPWSPGPPLTAIGWVNRPRGLEKDQAPGNKILAWRARIERWIRRPLGDRDVACRRDEARELAVGDRMSVDPDLVDVHFAHRSLFGIKVIRTHAKRAARNPDHSRTRWGADWSRGSLPTK